MALDSAVSAASSFVALSTGGGAPVADGNFLFEMIVADLHKSSLQVATLCMMTAACAAPEAQISMRCCRHITNDDPRVMRLALRYAADAGLSAEAGQKLDRLYADLAVMQKQFQPFVDPHKLTPTQRERLQRLLPWVRKVTLEAADAIKRLDPATRARLPANYADDATTIRQFLDRAAKGDIAEIDGFGVLATPAIKQRRHSPRAATNIPCRVALAQGEIAAAIIDVSRQGLGLDCAATLYVKQEVAVLIGGRRLEAEVARVQGRQIGLLLRRPLSFNDPLFRGG